MPNNQQDPILDALTEGVFTVDTRFCITSMNRATEEMTGITRAQAIGKPCRTIFRADICEGQCALAQTLQSHQPVHCRQAAILDANGVKRPVSISTNILKNRAGTVIGGVETFRDLSLVERLRRELAREWRLDDLLSRSPRMQRIFDLLPTVADSTSTVLISGESGTGKELVARALHNLSPRRKHPFVAVNCGALPDSLLESELFGYRKGAFTDAKKDKPGRFARAQGGTLFLDEIGDISQAMQVRLLRVLQERSYEPLGATAPVMADVRIVAATNRDLLARIASGDFRHDLYYRLNVVHLELPPLRDRLEDIPLLCEHFISKLNALNNRSVPGISNGALSQLAAHSFPGNVRELENLIERAFVLCRSGPIEIEHLPDALRTITIAKGVTSSGVLAAAQAQSIRAALDRHQWNRQATAKELGIHTTTLYRMIRRYRIQKPL